MRIIIRSLGYILLCSVLAGCATQGKPGTLLPAPNKEIGKKWPPEVQEFIDAMLTVFVDGRPTPSEAELEQALKVKLVGSGHSLLTGVTVEKRIQSWPLNSKGWSLYRQSAPDPDGRQYVTVDLEVDTQRYCINPYDFAIYTGYRFMPVNG